jgi:GxxExxY protein
MYADALSGQILEAAVAVHRKFGPGLLESVYEVVLAHELNVRGLRVRRQHPVRLEYLGTVFSEAFRVDLLVEDTIVVELKSAAKNDPIFERQLLTYLRLMGLPVGLVLNFGCQTLLAGVKRVVNNAPGHVSSRVRVNAQSRPQDPA